MHALLLLKTFFLFFWLLSCAPLPDIGLASAETAKSDDAILLKLEEDFTCPITQVSLASTAPCMLCVTVSNITNLLAIAAFECPMGCSHSTNLPLYMFSVHRTCAIYDYCSSWHLSLTASHPLFPFSS